MSLNFILQHEDEKPECAVLLFHGLTGSPFELKKYGQFLFNKGYDVYAECLPGHGEKFEEIYTVRYQDWLDFSYSKFEELKSQYKQVFISGICLGAVLAIAVAVKYKEEVAGVISLSTTLFLDGWRLPWYKFLIPLGLSTIIRYYYSYPECEPHGIKNEKTRKVVKKLLEKGDVGMNDFPMTGIYELLKLSSYLRKNLNKMITPILLVHSKDDDLTSPKSAKTVHQNISSNDKEMIILNDSYHMVLYDNEKEFVFNKSIEFIEKRLNKTINKEAVLC